METKRVDGNQTANHSLSFKLLSAQRVIYAKKKNRLFTRFDVFFSLVSDKNIF